MNSRPNKLGFFKILSQTLQTLLTIVSETFSLAALELQLVGKNLLIMLVLTFVGMLFLLSFWLLTSFSLVLGLMKLHMNGGLAVLTVALFNLLLLIPVAWLMLRAKRRLKFPATSRQLFNYEKNHETTTSSPAYEPSAES